MEIQEVESVIKSCVLSKKGDMVLAALRREYEELVGEDIPFKKCGYESLEGLLNDLPGVSVSINAQGLPIVRANSRKAAHIANLVGRQKVGKTKFHGKNKGKASYSPKKFVHTQKRNISKNPLSAIPKRSKLFSSTYKFRKQNDLSHSCNNPAISKRNLKGFRNMRTSSTQVRYFSTMEEPGIGSSYSSSSYSSPERIQNYVSLHANGGSENISCKLQVELQQMSKQQSYNFGVPSSSENSEYPSTDIITIESDSNESPSNQSLGPEIVYESSNIFSGQKQLTFPNDPSIPEATDSGSIDLVSESDISVLETDYLNDSLYSEDTCWSKDHHRYVHYTGTSIKCVLSATPVKKPYQPSDNMCSSWDYGPIMLGFHLVGDDFLLQFAYECLKVDCDWEDDERLSCGMCISGQTIHDFRMQLNYEGIIPPRVCMMLGAVDILQGGTLSRIINDMTDLIQDMISVTECIALLTLPFFLNAESTNRKVILFNEYLQGLDDGHHVHVVDVNSAFCYRRGNVNYKNGEKFINTHCYERFMRNILCYPDGVVLWNHTGRCKVYNCLIQKLPGFLKHTVV